MRRVAMASALVAGWILSIGSPGLAQAEGPDLAELRARLANV